MSRDRKWAIGWVAYCSVVAAFDFTSGVITGHWYDYAFGAFMVALCIPNILRARQRKADSVMPTNDWINVGYATGGFIAAAPTSTPAPALTPKSLSAATPEQAPAKTPQDFHGVPFDFAVGEVYGLRMWRMDQYGRLRARNWTNAAPWRPGVNVATCVPKAEEDYFSSFMRAAGLSNPSKPQPKPPHDTPSENCACGIYAYTDSHHAETLPFAQKNGEQVVLGIVKGTGRTLIGTKGFRCEKAEIVALRDPTRGGAKTDSWRLRQLENLKRVYPEIPLLESRAALLEFAPLTKTLPDPSTDEFWKLP